MSVDEFRPHFGREGQIFYIIQKGTESRIGFIPALWSNNIDSAKEYIENNIDKKYKKEIWRQVEEVYKIPRKGMNQEIFRKGVELLRDVCVIIPSNLKMKLPNYMTITDGFKSIIVGYARNFEWEGDSLTAMIEFYDNKTKESVESGEMVLTVSLKTTEHLSTIYEAELLGIHIIPREDKIPERILT